MCGKCCHFEVRGKIHKCKYLVKLDNGKTLCRVYKTRLGRVIFSVDKDHHIICRERVKVSKKYSGCPYNDLIKEE